MNVLLFWPFEVSVSVAWTGWKIQCHMVDGGDCPITFLFRAQSLVTPCLIPVPGFQLRFHAPHLGKQCVSPSCWLELTFTLSFLSAHVFGDLFSLVYLNTENFNHSFTRPATPLSNKSHFFHTAHIIASFPISSTNPKQSRDRNEILDNCISPSLFVLPSHHRSWHF